MRLGTLGLSVYRYPLLWGNGHIIFRSRAVGLETNFGISGYLNTLKIILYLFTPFRLPRSFHNTITPVTTINSAQRKISL
jgi:hypothetical protein